MPRPPRCALAGVAQHVVQRGNNRGACFFDDNDRDAYLHWLRQAAGLHRVAVHAYVLMTNHVHLLLTPEEPLAVPPMMQTLGRKYVSFVNRKHDRTGTLWEGRYKSATLVSEGHILAAYRYIELNPVRAGIVTRPGDYRWSSHRANTGLHPDPLLTAHACYLGLGSTPRARCEHYLGMFDTAGSDP